MIGCLPTQALAFLAVFVYATQAIAFEWKPGYEYVWIWQCMIWLDKPQPQCTCISRLVSCSSLYRLLRLHALAILHWLRTAERIRFKLAFIVYRALHGTAPRYLSDLLRRVAVMPSRSRPRSSSTSWLDVRPSCRVTVRDRSFAVVGPRVWNSLPGDITSAPSLPVFRRKLKTRLFRQSYPDIEP